MLPTSKIRFFRIPVLGILFLISVAPAIAAVPKAPPPVELDLQVAFETELCQPIGQLRTIPLTLPTGERGFLLAYAADFDVDPWQEMFYYPTDTLKLSVVTQSGKVLWTHDLGRGLPPGHWFCPIFAFDLDGDGADEIWSVTNPDVDHPLGISNYRISRFNPLTGEETGSWPWPQPDSHQSLSHLFRNFIKGARVDGEPVLLTAQGTYGDMRIQAWNPDMTIRWTRHIRAEDPGARGSHMVPILDWDGDGSDELFWGERLVDLRTGNDIWCADEAVYSGHSDIIAPFFDEKAGNWRLFTCRENDPTAKPRVVVFDEKGNRVWGAIDKGHMDIGWVAHLFNPSDFQALAIRIGKKTLGPSGRFHGGVEEFLFDARTGEPVDIGMEVYGLKPADLTGDGVHELVAYRKERDGAILDGWGRTLGRFEGKLCFAGKALDLPGEQILTFTDEGRLRFYFNAKASDSAAAKARYASEAYQRNLLNCRSALSGL